MSKNKIMAVGTSLLLVTVLLGAGVGAAAGAQTADLSYYAAEQGASNEETAFIGAYGVGHCAVVGLVTGPLGSAACGLAYVG
jgi:hypothetical protein